MAYPEEMKEIFSKVKKHCRKPPYNYSRRDQRLFYVFEAFGDNDFRGSWTEIVNVKDWEWVWTGSKFLTNIQFKRQYTEQYWTE